MKKLFLAVWLLAIGFGSAYVFAKPAISCLASCNQGYVFFNSDNNTVEGLASVNCGTAGNRQCEFYSLLTVWYMDQYGQRQYFTSGCNGWILECGDTNYPLNTSAIGLVPGYLYTVVFSIYDVNRGCGTCSNPTICTATCSTALNIDLR